FVLPNNKNKRRTGKDRIIVLPTQVWRLIRWLNRRGEAGHVFTNSQGKPWNKDLFAKRFRRYADRAGVRKAVSAYSCRHGFCVAKLEAGAGERQLADLIGNATTQSVDWYVRSTRHNLEYLRKTAEKRE